MPAPTGTAQPSVPVTSLWERACPRKGPHRLHTAPQSRKLRRPRGGIMQDDDFSLFKAEVRGVKPITHDRAEVGKPKADRQKLAGLRQAATVRSDKALVIDGMSDQFVIDVGAEDELLWRRDGVQEGQLRK